MNKIYITSDLHFGHDKYFMYSPREFDTIQEHDETIVKNWNSIIDDTDTVFVLGDIMLGDNENGMKCLRQLRGHIRIVLGNHDTLTRINLYQSVPTISIAGYADVIKYRKYHFYLSHYPTLTDNFDGDKPLKARTINLCGHSHTQDRFVDMDKGLIYHVEMDAHNCFPVLLDDIIEDIKLVNSFEKDINTLD